MAQCPNDKTSLTPTTAEGHAGLRCASCAGMWLPYSYIDSFRHTRRFDPSAFKQQLVDSSKGAGRIHCPVGCGKLNVSQLGEAQLDWCPVCHGVWFDSGELRRLLEAHPKVGPGPGLSGNAAFIEVVIQGLTKFG